MKKIILLILLLAFLITGVLFLAFTPGGNALLLPYINTYLTKHVEGARVELLKLELKPDSVYAVAKVNDSIDVTANGPVDLMDQSFDLTYNVDAQKFQGQDFSIDTPLHVQGNAKGKIEDMHITGSGKAFASNIRYELTLQHNQPQNITLYLEDASIAEVLALAGQKPYARGRMSVEVNMPTLVPENPQGEAHLQIKNALLDTALIRQEYNISLPSDTRVNVQINARTQDVNLLAKGEIDTSLGDLKLNEINYHLADQRLDTNYVLDIPDLSKLQTVIQAPLGGKLDMSGNVSYHQGKIEAMGVTSSLGGESRFEYGNDRLNATLAKVDSAKVLILLGQAAFTKGNLSGSITFESLKKLKGKFDLKSSGSVNSSVVKKELDLNLGKKFTYSAAVNGEIKNQKVYARTTLDTTMAKLKMPDITYDIAKSFLRSSYHLYIDDLGKLQPLTKRKFRGDMDFNGVMTQSKDLVITGEGKEFGGSVNYKLFNSRIKADVKGATVSKVMYMLGYPQVVEALTEATVDYRFDTGYGKVDATLDSTQFLSTQFTFLLKKLLKIDLTREMYAKATFNSTISPSRFNFDFNAQNLVSHIKINKGTLDRRNEKLNIPVDMRYKDKDLKAKIRGTLKKPKVTLDSSAYLKSKVDKKVDKLLEEKFKGKGGEQIKGLLKGILKQ